MFETVKSCDVCGSELKYQSGNQNNVCYKCIGCGRTLIVPQNDETKAASEFAMQELLGEVHEGFVDWRITDWKRLYAELDDFMTHNEMARDDIHFQMARTACLTQGFNTIDPETYDQCKMIFKLTEKMYKTKLKLLKMQADSHLSESVGEYKESREKYIKCRNEYLNTKAMWKVFFFLLKKISLPF